MGTISERQLTKTQQEFLQDAITELALTRTAFAERISTPWQTFRKWLLPADSTQSREMPAIGWAMVNEVLEHERLKRKVAKSEKASKKQPRS
jgi:aspartate carbamoyltransferase catalytic subunit